MLLLTEWRTGKVWEPSKRMHFVRSGNTGQTGTLTCLGNGEISMFKMRIQISPRPSRAWAIVSPLLGCSEMSQRVFYCQVLSSLTAKDNNRARTAPDVFRLRTFLTCLCARHKESSHGSSSAVLRPNSKPIWSFFTSRASRHGGGGGYSLPNISDKDFLAELGYGAPRTFVYFADRFGKRERRKKERKKERKKGKRK